MKTLNALLFALLMMGVPAVSMAQDMTVDEILDNYFENTGGLDTWKALAGIKMEGTVNFGGVELPITMVQLKDGRSMIMADFQGQKFYQNVFDGETLWGTNQMTMAAEKSDAEATENFKNELNDFPESFIDYREKGYSVELLGTETVEGTETYKIKLVKEPIKVDGVEAEDIAFYFFDTENFVPIVVEKEVKSGPMAGMVSQSKLSDYQEVEGLFFPFSITEGAKGMPGGQTITFTNITLNPEVEDSLFAFPEPAASEEKKD